MDQKHEGMTGWRFPERLKFTILIFYKEEKSEDIQFPLMTDKNGLIRYENW